MYKSLEIGFAYKYELGQIYLSHFLDIIKHANSIAGTKVPDIMMTYWERKESKQIRHSVSIMSGSIETMKLRQTQLSSRLTNVFILQGSSKKSHLSQYRKESQHSYCSPFLGIFIYILNTTVLFASILFTREISVGGVTNLDPQEPRHRHCGKYHQHDSIPLTAYDSKQSCFHKSPLYRIHIKQPGPPSGPEKEDLSAINLEISK